MMFRKVYELSVLEIFERFIFSKYIWILFFITAAIIFSPFFLQFKFIVSTTDSIYNHYPYLLYGYRAFKQGTLGLWNPYVFAGMNFTLTMHNHILNPANWILLLFPEHYIFQVVTFIEFIEIALIGILAFKIFNLLYQNRIVALFAAIITQLSGFTWFITTTYVGVEFFLVTILYIYLILTWRKRGHLANFVTMTLCAFLIFTNGEVGYISSFFLVVGIVFVVFNYKEVLFFWRGITLVFILSILFGLLMSLYRLLPELLHVYHQVQAMFPPVLLGTNAYYALTGFIPSICGLTVSESSNMFTALGVTGRNVQFHNLLYFSLPLMFLTYFGLLNVFGRFIRLFSVLTLAIAITPLFVIQPLSDLISFILMPFIHDAIFRIGSAFLFFALAGLIANAIYHERFRINKTHIKSIIFLVGICLCLAIAFQMRLIHVGYFHDINHTALVFNLNRILLLVIFLSSLLAAFYIPVAIRFSHLLTNWMFAIVFFITLVLFFVALRFNLFHTWATFRVFCYYLGTVFWALLSIIILRLGREPIDKFWRLILLFGLVAMCVILLLVSAPDYSFYRGIHAFYFCHFIIIIKFIVLSVVIWEFLVALYHKKINTKDFLILLSFLVLGGLLFHTKIYSFAGGPDFASKGTLYPPVFQPARSALNAALQSKDLKVKNLLRNATFKPTKPFALRFWTLGRKSPKLLLDPSYKNTVILKSISSIKLSTVLYQNRDFKKAFPITIAFGAWVKSNSGSPAYLYLVGRSSKDKIVDARSSYTKKQGQWEWLMTSIYSQWGFRHLRAHIFITSKGAASIFAPRMVPFLLVHPVFYPPGHRHDRIYLKQYLKRYQSISKDSFKQYRINNPDTYIHNPFGTGFMDNFIVYQIRGYSGVQSVVPARLVQFISHFQKRHEGWYGQAGINPVLTNTRVLDLLGVKYNFTADGKMKIRPNALARISLFNHYKVIASKDATFTLLKNPKFNIYHTVILNRDPGWKRRIMKQHFLPVNYRSPDSDHISVKLDLQNPGIIFFGDTYSSDWRAYWNRKEIPIMLANGYFMAVSVPAGKGVLKFVFHPALFFNLVKLSFGLFVIWVFLLCYLLFNCLFRKK